jgi:hypothetical protein
MAIVMDRGTVTTLGRGRPGAAMPSHLSITIYALITAIRDIVGLEGDSLVVATVRNLLRSAPLTVRGTGTRRSPPGAKARLHGIWRVGRKLLRAGRRVR